MPERRKYLLLITSSFTCKQLQSKSSDTISSPQARICNGRQFSENHEGPSPLYFIGNPDFRRGACPPPPLYGPAILILIVRFRVPWGVGVEILMILTIEAVAGSVALDGGGVARLERGSEVDLLHTDATHPQVPVPHRTSRRKASGGCKGNSVPGSRPVSEPAAELGGPVGHGVGDGVIRNGASTYLQGGAYIPSHPTSTPVSYIAPTSDVGGCLVEPEGSGSEAPGVQLGAATVFMPHQARR